MYRWELDNVDHFTVAFYFQRFADATLGIARVPGAGAPLHGPHGPGRGPGGRLRPLSPRAARRRPPARRERRDRRGGRGHRHRSQALRLGRRQGVRHRRAAHAPRGTGGTRSRAAQRRPAGGGGRAQVAWDGPPRERRAVPKSDAGFVEAGREYVKPWEIDAYGQCAMSFYVHRFAAANGHAIAAFGMTPVYQRERQRGFSTFEFQLEFLGDLRAGDPVVVRAGLLHVGSSSLRVFHRMSNPRTGAAGRHPGSTRRPPRHGRAPPRPPARRPPGARSGHEGRRALTGGRLRWPGDRSRSPRGHSLRLLTVPEVAVTLPA